MAKEKPAKANKSKPAPAKRKSPVAKTGAAPNAEKPKATDDSPGFTGIAIGHVAGEVWGVLSDGPPRTIADIKKAVKAPGDTVLAAIGWLAREDKLEFVTSGKTVRIALR